MVWPTFYSDTWGDYWGYFTVIQQDFLSFKATGKEMIPYMGRVNLVSIYPSLILLAGFLGGGIALIKGLRSKEIHPEQLFLAFLFMTIGISWIGYLWFLISYTFHDGVNNKATYMIQIFMALPILASMFMEKIRTINSTIYKLGMLVLLLVFIHNLPAMITRYQWNFLFH
jgi:hypothetical protein